MSQKRMQCVFREEMQSEKETRSDSFTTWLLETWHNEFADRRVTDTGTLAQLDWNSYRDLNTVLTSDLTRGDRDINLIVADDILFWFCIYFLKNVFVFNVVGTLGLQKTLCCDGLHGWLCSALEEVATARLKLSALRAEMFLLLFLAETLKIMNVLHTELFRRCTWKYDQPMTNNLYFVAFSLSQNTWMDWNNIG